MMRNIRGLIVGAVLTAAVAALFAGFTPGIAHAQGGAAFYIKRVPLVAARNSNLADNPYVATNPGQTAYTSSLLNGWHGAAASGTTGIGALGTMDTTAAIDVREHWLKTRVVYLQAPLVADLADSTFFGTLKLTSTASTIDTVTIQRDVSVDGITWTVVDSIAGHVISDTAPIFQQSQTLDSTRVIMPASGSVTAYGAGWDVYPFGPKTGVTALALEGVNFIRFRIHMTPGDYAAAGATGGIRGTFEFPSADSNPYLPARAVPAQP
jgi:hypothetical protein